MLAGVRKDTLKLLEGASYSGELKKPLTVEIAVAKSSSAGGRTHPRNEYILRNKIEEKARWRFTGSLSWFFAAFEDLCHDRISQTQAGHKDGQAPEYETIDKE